MMKIAINTHQNNLYNEVIDYVVLYDESSNLSITVDSPSLVMDIDDGCIKLVRGADEIFIAFVNGRITNSENNITLLAKYAHVGRTIKSAREHLEILMKK